MRPCRRLRIESVVGLVSRRLASSGLASHVSRLASRIASRAAPSFARDENIAHAPSLSSSLPESLSSSLPFALASSSASSARVRNRPPSSLAPLPSAAIVSFTSAPAIAPFPFARRSFSSSSARKSRASSASAPDCDSCLVFSVMNPFASSLLCLALGPNRRAPPWCSFPFAGAHVGRCAVVIASVSDASSVEFVLAFAMRALCVSRAAAGVDARRERSSDASGTRARAISRAPRWLDDDATTQRPLWH